MAKTPKSPKDLCRRAAQEANRVVRHIGRRLTGRKFLTVVIPLYNAMPYFKKTVDSILAQTYDLRDVEVLLMDDGSTDGGLEYAEQVAAQHPGLFRVVRCGRTGGPSIPRNTGIEKAKGKYIFFCDADDYFGEDAFRRMVRHAEEWKPDVMLVKLATPDGRPIAKAPFRKGSIPRADIYSDPVCDSLTCYKLFRTKPLRENGTRFNPDFTLREDDLFVEEAILRTKRHSIAADYPYYYVTTRNDGSNLIALSPPDFERDLKVFSQLRALLERYADMDKVLCGDRIMQRVFRYSWMGAAKAIGLCDDAEERRVNFERLKDASSPYLDAEGVKFLPSSMRLLVKAMQLNDEPYFSELAAAIGVTQEYGFDRYDVLKEDVREENGLVFWHPTFAGHQLEIEVDFLKVLQFPRRNLDSPSSIPFDAYIDFLKSNPDSRSAFTAVLKDIAPYLKRFIGRDDRVFGISEQEALLLREKLAGTMSLIAPDAFFSEDNSEMGFDHKAGLAFAFHGETPPSQKVYIRRVYPGRHQIRCQVFAEMPSLVIGGTPKEPDSQKESVRNFLYSPLFCAYEFILSYEKNSDEIIFDFEGSPSVVIDVNGKCLPNGAKAGAIARAFCKSWKKYPQNGDCWIVMDRDMCADDNGEHFYRYLMRHQPQQACYFALRRESPDWERLKKEGFKLLDYGSEDYEQKLRKSSTIVSSHIDGYVTSYFGDKFNYSKRIVFLQHGVIKDDLSSWLNARTEMDLMVTSTDAEYQSIVEDGSPYRLLPEEVVLSGLPRHDALVEKMENLGGAGQGKNRSRTILVMPTWRKNLLGKMKEKSFVRELSPDFAQSKYAESWGAFLRSDFVKNWVEQGNRLVFFPHANMVPYIEEGLFDVPRYIECMTNVEGDSIQEQFLKADVFVTDYSSAVFDEAVVFKPCVYYHFEEAEGQNRNYHFSEGYFDYERDGFGPVCYTQEELERQIMTIHDNEFRVGEPYERRMRQTIRFRDGGCCERVYRAIKALT